MTEVYESPVQLFGVKSKNGEIRMTIDILKTDQVKAVRQELLDLSENGNDQGYAAKALEFMRACGVPAVAIAEDGNAVESGASVVKSMINGVPIYAIHDTTKNEYEGIRDKARGAYKLWNELPLVARQEFFRIMAEEVGPKYKDAIDLAITLDVGKAGSEFAKLAEWDKWAASQSVHDHICNVYLRDDRGRIFTSDAIPADSKHVFYYMGPEAKGAGVAGGTNGFNYPGALIMPDVASSRVGGNALIAKAPAKAPAFLFIRKKAEEEALELMKARFNDYAWAGEAKGKGIDFTEASTLQSLKDGLGIISGRGVIEQWTKDSSTFRMVGGGAAGKIYRDYRETAGVDPSLHRTILELAGNNPVAIMPSAQDLADKTGAKLGLEKIVKEIAEGNKGNSGQRCTSPRRWFVHADIYDKVRDLAVAEYTRSENNADGAIANPLDPNTKIGAMDEGGFKMAQEYLEKCRNAGAKVIGGQRIFENKFPKAQYMAPALVIWDGVPEEKKALMHEREIFAPIANLEKVADLAEAISKTNLSKEHLSGAIYTNDKTELEEYAIKTNLGSLMHIMPPKDQSPAGLHAGRDQGGIGETGGHGSLEQYLIRTGNPRMIAMSPEMAKNFRHKPAATAAKG